MRKTGGRLEGVWIARVPVAGSALRRFCPRYRGHVGPDLLLQFHFSLYVFDGALARVDALASRVRANALAA